MGGSAEAIFLLDPSLLPMRSAASKPMTSMRSSELLRALQPMLPPPAPLPLFRMVCAALRSRWNLGSLGA